MIFKVGFVLFCSVVATTTTTTSAFVPKSQTSGYVRRSQQQVLFDYPPKDRVVSAGGGIPITAPGDRSSFWDPAIEGKLGNTPDVLNDRISQGCHYQYLKPQSTTSSSMPPQHTDVTVYDAQHWLEGIGLPLNFAKPNKPVKAKLLGKSRLITDDAPGDIQHIVLELPPEMHYVEGQSISIIPPGFDPVTGKPHKPRLYSIASTRYGDLLNGRTVSLCVRRAEYTDPNTGMVDPTKKGVCSNFLCDAPPGSEVNVAGPVGKTMLLPEDPTTDIIMVATGTGIAPFRGFLHRLFMEHTVSRHTFAGKAWLILGVPTTGGLLYQNEFDAMQNNAQSGENGDIGTFEITYAISREMYNKNGGKLYVQDVLSERSDELFTRLENGAQIYFCGLKGMMPGILEALERVAIQRGIDWNTKLKELQAKKQWHVEVY